MHFFLPGRVCSQANESYKLQNKLYQTGLYVETQNANSVLKTEKLFDIYLECSIKMHSKFTVFIVNIHSVK